MVEGMKQEARQYLAAGGTVVEYGKRLTERQDAEITIYNRVKADIENARKTMSEAAFMTYWEKRNDELRNLGIKTIGLSDDWWDYQGTGNGVCGVCQEWTCRR